MRCCFASSQPLFRCTNVTALIEVGCVEGRQWRVRIKFETTWIVCMWQPWPVKILQAWICLEEKGRKFKARIKWSNKNFQTFSKQRRIHFRQIAPSKKGSDSKILEQKKTSWQSFFWNSFKFHFKFCIHSSAAFAPPRWPRSFFLATQSMTTSAVFHICTISALTLTSAIPTHINTRMIPVHIQICEWEICKKS